MMPAPAGVPNFGPPRPAPPLERLYAKVRFLPTTAAFIWSGVRDRPRQLWIGDSHAMTFIRPVVNSHFLRGHHGEFIARAGARLMFSIARTGFPPTVTRVARLARRCYRPGTVVPFFVAGEIDVRAHLVNHPDDFGFVQAYVDRCAELAHRMGAARGFLVVPPPPVEMSVEESWYPIVGSTTERVRMHRRLRHALEEATSGSDFLQVLDFTHLLADEQGAMPVTYTDDGCHTNADRVRAIRKELDLLDWVGC